MATTVLIPRAGPFNDDSGKMVRVGWSDEAATQIEVTSKRTGMRCLVEFESVAGLRMLNELDLAAMWDESEKDQLRSSWLFEVVAGGWFELEATRDDFYTKHQPRKPREFLVAGYQECLSVFAFSEPKVHEANSTKGV